MSRASSRTRPCGFGARGRCRRKPGRGRGRPTSRTRRDPEHQPVQVKALALELPKAAWQTITWREGSADWLTSRYARLRVRAAHRDERLKERRAEEWLLIEWPEDEKERQNTVRHAAVEHSIRRTRRSRQAALADRARLPGPQAGTRTRPLRGTRLARPFTITRHCASPLTAS